MKALSSRFFHLVSLQLAPPTARFERPNYTVNHIESQHKMRCMYYNITDREQNTNSHFAKMSLMLKRIVSHCYHFRKSELHGPTCYHCLWCGVKMKPCKMHFKEVKIYKLPDLSYSFLPIDCCVRINGKPDGLFSGDMQSTVIDILIVTA